MKRREFIAATAGLLVSPWRSSAQGTRRRLGFLAVGDASGRAPNYAELALFDGLRSHGWIDGRNLIIEYRFGQDRLPALAAELVALSPDGLIVPGPRASLALKSATATIPIVFVAMGDPVGLGLVQSLSHPGGNVTGLATLVPEDFLGKRIGILRELVPGASKIAILVNPGNPMHRLQFADAEYLPRTARKLGVALPTIEATTAEELDVAFASAAAQHADAIVDLGDVLTFVEAPRVIALAAKYHLPATTCSDTTPTADCPSTAPI
jgi:putative ABC transport system substrate-binding protein